MEASSAQLNPPQSHPHPLRRRAGRAWGSAIRNRTQEGLGGLPRGPQAPRSWSFKPGLRPSPSQPPVVSAEGPCRKFQPLPAGDGVFPAGWEQLGASRRLQPERRVSRSPRVPCGGVPPAAVPRAPGWPWPLRDGRERQGSPVRDVLANRKRDKGVPLSAPHSFQVIPARPRDSRVQSHCPPERGTPSCLRQ